MGLIISILGFGFLVLIHEFGHFILARINGVKVEEFSVGMGPRLFSIQGKQTKYSLKILPLGGSCQMKGESTGEDDNDEDSFQSKSTLRRMSIIFAGPFMNILTALVFFSLISSINGYATNIVNKVDDSSPAADAGIMKDDKIISIDGNKTRTFKDLLMFININEGKELDVVVDRANEKKNFKIKPLNKDGQYILGFNPKVVKNPSLIDSIKRGFVEAESTVRQTLYSLKLMVTGRVNMNQVAGPITIVKIGSAVANNSFIRFIELLAFLSINLAVLNLLPFPALDGGWMLILFIELITRKKLNEKFLNIWNTVGFVLIMTLSALVIFKDIFFPPTLR